MNDTCFCGDTADEHDDGIGKCHGDDQGLECECKRWKSPMLSPAKEIINRFTYRGAIPNGYIYMVIFASNIEQARLNLPICVLWSGDSMNISNDAWQLIAADADVHMSSQVIDDGPKEIPQ